MRVNTLRPERAVQRGPDPVGRGGGRAGGRHAEVSRSAAATEAAAERSARPPSGIRHGVSGPLPTSVGDVLAEPGTPLDRRLAAPLELRFAHDFSRVRIHADTSAAESAQDVGARAYTVGRDIVFGAGRFLPSTPGGRQLLVHELTHVAEQSRTGHDPRADQGSGGRDVPFGALQRDALADLPLAERRGIKVSTVPVVVPAERVAAYFATNEAGRPAETTTLTGTTTVFGSGVDTGLRIGLASVGAWLAGSTNALPLGSTIEVELDLSAYGAGTQRVRYTRSRHRTGRDARATESQRLLVELAGSAITPSAPPQQVPSSVQVGGASFSLTGAWPASDFAALDQALRLLPPDALTGAHGLTFLRKPGVAPGSKAGHFDAENDRIVLYENAFPSASLRVGGRTLGVRNIVHEIGHALDLRPMEQAWRAFNAAGQSTAARRQLLKRRSTSGSRWVRDQDGDYQQEQMPGRVDVDFRRAAQRDGVLQETDATRTTPEGEQATLRGGITGYADANYEEMYAETFALYITDPAVLRALRPSTYTYFSRNYPRRVVP